MSSDILEKDLTQLFGLDEMSQDEQDTFLEDVGNLILESVMMRLTANMDDQEMEALSGLLETASDAQDILKRLEKNYPEVNDIFREEIIAFKKEAVAVLAAKDA